ncbi:hypothetical protein Zmor_005999 [Zophobas morio]|uniref:Uncharacterized protein n=1 Tax=Zophobas morio TaxID=2755281 RepID=A0AA38MMH0_9CUCU|nr:hypothetical protein Zmor_005999 [Zophobas morio]
MGEKQESEAFEDSDETDMKLQKEAKHRQSTPKEMSNQRNRSFSTSDIPTVFLDLTADDEEVAKDTETRGEQKNQIWWQATPKRRLGETEKPTETEDEAKKLLKVLHKTANEISKLSQVVAKNPNTKREIKTISSGLVKSASQLLNEKLTIWLAGKVISPKSKRQKQEEFRSEERIKELENKLKEAEARDRERQAEMEELKEMISKMKEEQEISPTSAQTFELNVNEGGEARKCVLKQKLQEMEVSEFTEIEKDMRFLVKGNEELGRLLEKAPNTKEEMKKS